MRVAAVIGLGEIGAPIAHLLLRSYGEADIICYDINHKTNLIVDDVEFLHICFPYSGLFCSHVKRYQDIFRAKITIIHSSVPIGTTDKIENAVHSPVLGKHDNMEKSLLSFDKWIGGNKAREVGKHLSKTGMSCVVTDKASDTEFLKLVCLAKYGLSIAFAGYIKKSCDNLGINYGKVLSWDKNYNAGVDPSLRRPIITPPENDQIGGHCIIPGTEKLNELFPNQMLDEILKYSGDCGSKAYKAWPPCNIYPTATIGRGASIGSFSEIGHNVSIGDFTRIGAMSFIPEGVEIGREVFIGPRFTGTNDKYPPSGKSNWKSTIIKDGARIGAAVTVLCGITIGNGALIGAGSVVTKDVPDGETWYGCPASKDGK